MTSFSMRSSRIGFAAAAWASDMAAIVRRARRKGEGKGETSGQPKRGSQFEVRVGFEFESAQRSTGRGGGGARAGQRSTQRRSSWSVGTHASSLGETSCGRRASRASARKLGRRPNPRAKACAPASVPRPSSSLAPTALAMNGSVLFRTLQEYAPRVSGAAQAQLACVGLPSLILLTGSHAGAAMSLSTHHAFTLLGSLRALYPPQE